MPRGLLISGLCDLGANSMQVNLYNYPKRQVPGRKKACGYGHSGWWLDFLQACQEW